MFTSPLIIKTTNELGLQCPLGLIVNELRTHPDETLVVDAESDDIYLDISTDTSYVSMRSDETDFGLRLDTSIVRELLNTGFTQEM